MEEIINIVKSELNIDDNITADAVKSSIGAIKNGNFEEVKALKSKLAETEKTMNEIKKGRDDLKATLKDSFNFNSDEPNFNWHEALKSVSKEYSELKGKSTEISFFIENKNEFDKIVKEKTNKIETFLKDDKNVIAKKLAEMYKDADLKDFKKLQEIETKKNEYENLAKELTEKQRTPSTFASYNIPEKTVNNGTNDNKTVKEKTAFSAYLKQKKE